MSPRRQLCEGCKRLTDAGTLCVDCLTDYQSMLRAYNRTIVAVPEFRGKSLLQVFLHLAVERIQRK